MPAACARPKPTSGRRRRWAATSELDEGNRGLVLAELRAEADRGAVVVVATHEPAVVAACDDHHALDEGRLVVARPLAG